MGFFTWELFFVSFLGEVSQRSSSETLKNKYIRGNIAIRIKPAQ